MWALPWVSGLIARDFNVQTYTIALLMLGVYQLKLLTKRAMQPTIVTRGKVAHRTSDLATDPSHTAEAASPAFAR